MTLTLNVPARGATNWAKNSTNGIDLMFTTIINEVNGLVLSGIAGGNVFGVETISSAIDVEAADPLQNIILATFSASGKTLTMPDVTSASYDGATIYIYNEASNSFALKDNAGGTIVATVPIGDVIVLHLTSNSSAAGTWRVLNDELSANLSVAGYIKTAAASDINTGTNLTKAITAGALSDSDSGLWLFEFVIAAPVVGNGAVLFESPAEVAGMNIVIVRGQWSGTIGTGAASSFQLHNLTQAADVLSTNLTIDDGERSSSTAAAAAVIDTGQDDITLNDVFQIDVDVIGSTVPGTDLLFQAYARII